MINKPDCPTMDLSSRDAFLAFLAQTIARGRARFRGRFAAYQRRQAQKTADDNKALTEASL